MDTWQQVEASTRKFGAQMKAVPVTDPVRASKIAAIEEALMDEISAQLD